MNKSVILKNKIILYLSFLVTFFIFIYLVYFLINGQRGLLKYLYLTKQAHEYNSTLTNLMAENNYYLDRTKRLKPNSLDLDYLDEQARKKLGFTHSNDFIVYTKNH